MHEDDRCAFSALDVVQFHPLYVHDLYFNGCRRARSTYETMVSDKAEPRHEKECAGSGEKVHRSYFEQGECVTDTVVRGKAVPVRLETYTRHLTAAASLRAKMGTSKWRPVRCRRAGGERASLRINVRLTMRRASKEYRDAADNANPGGGQAASRRY